MTDAREDFPPTTRRQLARDWHLRGDPMRVDYCACGKELGCCEVNCLKCECYCERVSSCCRRPEHYAVEGFCGCGEGTGFQCSLHEHDGYWEDGLCPAIEEATAT